MKSLKKEDASLSAVRPKILFVLPSLAAGGAERVLITLMNEQNHREFECSLVVVNEEGPLRDIVSPEVDIHILGSDLRVRRALPKLFLKLKSLKPDLVVSTMAHMNFAVLLLKFFFPNTRFIVREAITLSFFFQNEGLRGKIIRLAYKVLYPKADKIISPAQIIIDEFKDLITTNPGTHELLYNPVDVERLRGLDFKSSAPLRSSGDVVEFICAGRLHSQKGFDQLIKSLPRLKMEHNWRLTILGEGKQRPELDDLIKSLGLQDHVKLQGYVSAPWPYIAQADIFLMPSRWEGLPNTVLEALACGTPVIATRSSGGIQEIAERVDQKSLVLVDTMDQMIQGMSLINPNPVKTYRDSLLPEYFYKELVCKRFSQIIQSALSG